MKTLYLIRHAKSSWDEEGLADRDRPLNDRGKRDAPKMGKRLAARRARPDLILSSTAVRALTTAEIVAKELGYKRKAIVVDERIYAAELTTLLNIIGALDDAHAVVMIFGHNPELTTVARYFSNEIDDMPTCAVAEFEFDVAHWREAPTAKPSSVIFETPKKVS